jgi:excisionase family DNA binding protein
MILTYHRSATGYSEPSPNDSNNAPNSMPLAGWPPVLRDRPSQPLPTVQKGDKLMADELVTPDELAARLKATTRFVRRLVAERRIAYVKVGRLVRFEESAVVEYLDRHKVAPIDRDRTRRHLRTAA